MKHSISTLMVFVFLLVTGSLCAQQSGERSGAASTARVVAAEPASPAVAAPAQANAQALVPRLMKFNGTLRDLAGKPIAGPVDVTFALYTDESGGSPLWFETQTIQASSLGRYTVLLGAMTPTGVPMELFAAGEARWLGIQVSNLPEQPRVLLVSVPYALKAGDAETLGGKPASAFMMAGSSTATNPTLSGLVQASALTSTRGSTIPQAITAGGTANYIAGWAADGTSLGTSAIYQDPTTNRIGIGTATPSFGLDVNNNVFAIGPKAAQPGAGGTMRFRDDTGTVRWAFGLPGSAGATDFFMANAVNGHAPLYIEASAPSYGLYLKANGYLGIGTNTPSYGLDLNSSVFAVGPKTAHPGAGGTMRFRDDTGTVRWAFGLPVTAGATDFFVANAVNGHQPLYIQAGAPSYGLYLTSSGNVGIGTAAPAYKLDVTGDINASTNINAGGSLAVTGTITGNGSGLTSLSATSLTGTLPNANLSGTYTRAVTLNNASNSFSGNGAGLTNVDAATLNGIPVGSFATLGSNAFVGDQMVTGNLTVTASQTISGDLTLNGTVNGWQIVPYTEQSCPFFGTSSTCVSGNVLGGYTGFGGKSSATSRMAGGKSVVVPVGANVILDKVIGGTIAGGGGAVNGYGYGHLVTNHWATVAGGASNQAGDGTDPTTSIRCCQSVGGGIINTASGEGATVAGGENNKATGDDATIAGGGNNQASGNWAAVAGGDGNVASGITAIVAGGSENIASGYASFAAGCLADAAHDGAFVWNGDHNGCPTIASSAAGQFVVNAPGGLWLGSVLTHTTATQPAGDFIYTTTGAYLTTSGVWTDNSDRNLKTAFQPLEDSSVLARIGQLPITSWQYKADPSSIRHIGPMAQDFYLAFKLGNDDKHISTVDEGGVALAGVQALYRLSVKKDAEIRALKRQADKLKSENQELAQRVEELSKAQQEMANVVARLAKRQDRTRLANTMHSISPRVRAKPGQARKADATKSRKLARA